MISEDKWKLVDMLIDIYDDEDFVNYVATACETDEDVKEVTDYIESNKPNDEDITSYVVRMRLRNKTHPIYKQG